MDDEVRRALDERILAELEDISKMESGCEVKRAAIDDLTAIYKLRLEEIRLANELEVQKREIESREEIADDEMSMKQLEISAKDVSEQKRMKLEFRSDWIKKGLDVITTGFSVIMPLAFYGVWMDQGLSFEETGVFKSGTLKNLLHFIKPTK